ncbi:BlaI/MecI/CopY family transcriptional regulator [Clostridium sp. P21]|uniref:BlaI/MecI/CopY family transcriptional regulator n=1 Tax=Clostridium muellerianum TaxID=2716538 RepID=A0A7Y0EI67_9CLOT|nr:BlaI/MecI/CopY family transcriptional regulator [Clostridium muellerianum]NMM63923.1 BlaI/MecI/CopY family transcriptional regulator [Clostridium muellerianum]
MSDLPKISEAEYKVMKIIWLNAPISTNGVIDKLIEITTWSPKTIQTLLSRLVKKGALTYEKNSRTFVYTPLVKEEDYLERESRSFLNRFYNGTLSSMVLSFLEKDKLTEDDINELKDILDKKAKGNNKNV